MIKKLLPLLLIYASLSAHAEGSFSSYSIDSIGNIIEQSVINHDIETYLRFFPTQKSTFYALFGFYDEGFSYIDMNRLGHTWATAPLYGCESCIPFLFDVICKNDSIWHKYEWYIKPLLVNLAISIKEWEADNVNFLQDGIIEVLFSRDELWYMIEDLPSIEKADFWHFILDGPVSQPELYQRIVKHSIRIQSSLQTQHIIEETYESLKREQWDFYYEGN